MIILGINFGHDAAASLIRDGKTINAIEEEKISRVKQDFGWPNNAVDVILKQQNLTPDDIDYVVFGGRIYNSIGKNEIKYRFNKDGNYKRYEIIDRITSYYNITTKKISDENQPLFEKELKGKGFNNAKVVFCNHHLCHANTAHYCSPFDVDLVITSDGHGDGHAMNFYVNDSENRLKCIRSNDYKTSVGQFYSAITTLLGFRATRHEGKITGLAAFGEPTGLVEKFSDLFYYEDDTLRRFPYGEEDKLWKLYKVDQGLSLKYKINLNTSESEIGKAYAKSALILIHWLKQNTEGYSKEDIAFACQNVTEKVILKEIDIVVEKHFKNQKVMVGLAGGVFGNVRVNQKIYEKEYVKNIFVQPAMGDSGLALGAAINTHLSINDPKETKQFRFSDTFLGPNYSADIDLYVDSIRKDYEVIKMEKPAFEIAKLLADNKIIGFWTGNMEWGPRALGSRSILLNTFDKTVNDTLNKRLNRTEFMPFAPAVIDFMATTYFPEYKDDVPAGDYMTITYDVDPQYHEILQAVVHVDGTARPQIVRRDVTPYYYDIINEFYKLTGCGAIVNTSFNAHEEPIVNTPDTALNGLKNNRIDFLVLENYLVKKR